uniref:Uncharacterized protein n=1 Tax=viral metagenome TaxID=1070528 RepID=A0A6H1Z6K9_9ZZZZ
MTQEQNKGPVIKDFDAVSPPKRIAKLRGKSIDVTMIPSRVTLAMASFKDDMDGGHLSAREQIEQSVDLVSKITSHKDPEITKDWLLNNTDFSELMELINFVLHGITAKAEEYTKKQGNGDTAKS